MKRDHNYIRKILFDAEQWPKSYIGFTETSPFDNKSNQQAKYLQKLEHHLRLLEDKKLIQIREIRANDQNHSVEEYRLTSSGHDYLDAIRNDDNWTRLLSKFKEVGGVGLDIAIEIAKEELKKKVQSVI